MLSCKAHRAILGTLASSLVSSSHRSTFSFVALLQQFVIFMFSLIDVFGEDGQRNKWGKRGIMLMKAHPAVGYTKLNAITQYTSGHLLSPT